MKVSFLERFILYSLVCIVVITLCIALIPTPAQAHTNTVVPTRATAAATGHITIIVLDMSGSMATNDPNGLRCSAANAYIDLSGPGDFIGVVGLDNHDGNRGGSRNFQLAQVWTQPTEMATVAQRQGLQKTIASKSSNCHPDSSTPTYDSLNQALTMLATATQGRQAPASVILLTDGVPDPDTNEQIAAIQTDLVPQFKQHHWPIDTVALGENAPISAGSNVTFHDFLGGLSSATSGTFYDDGKGVVSGISPLNIAPFFVNIFAQRNSRTVKNDIPPTSLSGGATRRNFSVTDYTDSLDVVVVKDQSGTTASLKTPSGQVISGSGSGVFVSASDPHYVIFSIEKPQSGQWELVVNGSGQFLMNSLKASTIGVSIANIALAGSTVPAGSALPLGQPLTIASSLTSHGQPITDNRFTLTGTISYSGASGQYKQSFALDDKANPGTYVGSVTIPITAPPGTYDILINAFTVSENAVVASRDQTVSIELFPLPFFLSPQTGQTTESPIDTTVTTWDRGLQLIYSLPVIEQFSQQPLQNLPARPYASIPGQVQLKGQPYANATVTASATPVGSHSTIPVTVVNDGNGRFHILFLPPTDGTYTITFKTSGTFADSHGDFGTTSRSVNVTVKSATLFLQEIIAWAWTALYLLILFLIYRLFRYFITPRPFGEWLRIEDGDVIARHSFNQSRRNPIAGFFHRNILSSQDAGMPIGLLFRFNRGNSIEARTDGPVGSYWERDGGGEMHPQFVEIRELVYNPDREDDESERSTYTIIPREQQRPSLDNEDYI